MIVGQNSLLNQYVPTFYIRDLRDGQTVAYDSTRKAFINVDQGGGVPGSVTKLGDLSDVYSGVDLATNGQALVYNSITGLWGNLFVDYNTLQNKPTSASFSFAGLSDTAKPTVPNGYVLWNPAGNQLIYSTTIPATSVAGLAAVATSGLIGSLINVSPISDTLNNTTDVGKTLSWNGTKWIPANPSMRVVTSLSARDALTPSLGNEAYVTNSDDGSGDYVNMWSLWIYTVTGPSNGWSLITRQPASSTESATIETTFTFSTTSPITVGVLPTGGRITLITVEVIVPFNGTATLELGYKVDNPSLPPLIPSGLMSIGEIDLTIAGTYSTSSDIVFGVDTLPGDVEIIATFVSGASTIGNAQIIVSYV